jgi:hypothetical protein
MVVRTDEDEMIFSERKRQVFHWSIPKEFLN